MKVTQFFALIVGTGGLVFAHCSSAQEAMDKPIPLTSCSALVESLPLSRANRERARNNAVCIASQRYGRMLLLSNPWPESTLKVLGPRAMELADEFFDTSKDRLIASHAVKDTRFPHTPELVAARVGSISIMYSAAPPQPYDNRVLERQVLYISTGVSTHNLYYNPQDQIIHAGPP